MANYNIRFAGHTTRMADRDAQAVHLRLFKDGVYHQYFTAPVSGISLRLLEPQPGPEFWSHVVLFACKAIEEWVADGNGPEDDPETAVFVHIDPAAAHRAERAGGSGLTLPRNDVLIDGPEVCSFTA